MPRNDTASLIPGVVASGDWIIRICAIDPATGANVPGVKVSEASIAVRDISGSQLGEAAPYPLLVPEN